MTPRRGRPSAEIAPARPDVALHPGTTREAWCGDCRAWTSIAADLLLLTPQGVATAGTLTWCEVCEDPTSPLPARRIDRG
ncbi:hypothetical protein ACFY0G_32380 [Streptomyces sp. NPDC001552]|uniref:hypothetical protein n=1 Tax=Streptomyces sp. NPDC001552 TaxID=3364587 RepID=UPI0036BE973D